MENKEKKICLPPTLKEQGYFPVRYLTAVMCAIGYFLYFLLRINMNFAIVYMVKGNNFTNDSIKAVDVCGFNSTVQEDSSNEGEFEWDEWTQSLITGSFYWGYIWLQVPGGRLSEKIGGRYVLGASIILTGFINLLIPSAAYLGKEALITTRVLLGLVGGAAYPSLYAYISCWAPPQERTLLAMLCILGSQLSKIFTYPVSALIITNLGWKWVFYIPASITLCWGILWFIIVSDKPNTHRWISQAEKDYINQALGDIVSEEHPPVPWRALLTSLPLWAIVIAYVGDGWGFFFILTDLPLYMKEMMSEDINSNALWSALPYCGGLVVMFFTALLSDKLLRSQVTSRTVLRKVAHLLGQLGPAICLLTITFMDCDRDLAKILFIVSVTCGGFNNSGYLPNTLDIAPNFTGTIAGIVNAIGTIPGWLAPMTVGALTNDQQTFTQWHKAFYIAVVMYVGNLIFYLIFASGEVQPWNAVSKELKQDDVDLPNKKLKPSSSTNRKNGSKSMHQNDHNKHDETYSAYVINPNYRNTFTNPVFEENK